MLTAKEKRAWVRALRSGKYDQGKKKLVRGPTSEYPKARYCCLGVLVGAVFGLPNEEFLRYGVPSDIPPARLSPRKRTALYAPNEHDDLEGALARINDCGVPFEMIAGLVHHALPTKG